MEFTEVVSPSVAVPVLCVLVCAFLVFAFGFKSPAQPPSFDVFDEDGKKKRNKKSKGGKSQSNGHAVLGDGDNTVTSKPQSSPRQSSKLPTKPNSPTTGKNKLTAQEQPKKTRRQIAKEAGDDKPAKETVIEQEDQSQLDEGWHTISKKDKKQKKKEGERADSGSDEGPSKVEEGAKGDDTAEEVSPQEQRNKRKKDKKNKKVKAEPEPVEAAQPPVTEVKVAPVTVAPETKVEEAVEDAGVSTVELQIKDAMEMNDEEVQPSKKSKSKTKREKKKSPSPLDDDFVIPKSAQEPEVVLDPSEVAMEAAAAASSGPSESTVTKSPRKKQKKDKSKRQDEKPVVDVSSEEPSLSSNLAISPVDTVAKPPELEEPVVVTQAPESVESKPAAAAASFDELGGQTESWTEAKQKKKKKARRAD